MVNPGAFSGSRKVFLLSQKEYYANAVTNGFAAEAISLIQRRYFNRYPIELAHDQEPSEDHLATVDDEAAVQEPEEPNPESMTAEEYASALDRLEERQKAVYFRKAQIKRWFAYQYMKDLDLDANQTGIVNPYRLLMCQLTGKKINCPRQRSACNTWRKTAREDIEEKVKQLVKTAKDNGEKPETLIALRDRVARDMFKDLDEDEQQSWSEVAIAEHKVAIKDWKKLLEARPATDPKSQQIAIHGLIKFVQPILDQICEATGWKASFIAGGPEPAEGGLLNVVSVHSGITPGDVKMNFGRAERERFRKVIVPMYGGFLLKCYTPEECRSRALQPELGFLPLSQLDLDNEGASTDTISRTSSTAATILAPPVTSTPDAGQETLSTGKPSTKNIVSVDEDSYPTGASERGDRVGQERGEANRNTEEGETEDNPFPFDIPVESPIPSPCPSPPPEELSPAVAIATEFPDAAIVTDPPAATTTNESPAAAASPTTKTTAVATTTGSSPLALTTNSLSVAAHIAQTPPAPPSLVDENTPAATESASTRRSRRTARVDKAVEGDSRVGKRGKKRVFESETAAPGAGKVSAVKKARMAEAEPNAEVASFGDFTIPDDAPLWFKNAFNMVSSEELGGTWKLLLEKWGRFEMQARNITKPNLPKKNRPKAIGDWIQRARSTTWRPDIKNPASYGAEMALWWRGIQPEWRVLENGKLLRVSGGDLEDLKRPGVNGLLSVVVGLFFWGCKSQRGSQKGDWLEMVVDFDFVLAEFMKNV